MKIVVTTTKPVLTQFGRLQKGVPTDVPYQLAKFLIDRGDAVAYETKVAMERPTVAAGNEEPSSVLPAAPVSLQTTLPTSELGEKPKRRGRPPKNPVQ